MDCTHPGQGQTVYSWAGPGAGLGTPATGPSGRQSRLAGWAQLPHLPILPCARLRGPPMPPPPSLPLRPLHRLVRVLTCEIKRDFNYLSAKQQLERITAQQRSPPPLPLPGLPSPLHLQPPPRSEGVLQFNSGSLCPMSGVGDKGHEVVCVRDRAGGAKGSAGNTP